MVLLYVSKILNTNSIKGIYFSIFYIFVGLILVGFGLGFESYLKVHFKNPKNLSLKPTTSNFKKSSIYYFFFLNFYYLSASFFSTYINPIPKIFVCYVLACEKYIGLICSLSKYFMGKFDSVPPSVNLWFVKSIYRRILS